jgi:hypothetical protein
MFTSRFREIRSVDSVRRDAGALKPAANASDSFIVKVSPAATIKTTLLHLEFRLTQPLIFQALAARMDFFV